MVVVPMFAKLLVLLALSSQIHLHIFIGLYSSAILPASLICSDPQIPKIPCHIRVNKIYEIEELLHITQEMYQTFYKNWACWLEFKGSAAYRQIEL